MELFLHAPDKACDLSLYYKRAFANATELFVVTAYLTEWDASLKLNSNCRNFRVIAGRNFGITRKAACEALIRWLPPGRKTQFMVADRIGGFHPKALFWKEEAGGCFAVVGSSNLTQAAFGSNYEANVFIAITESDYLNAKRWVKEIERASVVVSEEWLKSYREAPLIGPNVKGQTRNKDEGRIPALVRIELPRPSGMKRRIADRQKNLKVFETQRSAIAKLFRSCAQKEIDSANFYERLLTHWNSKLGDRLQGRGFEIRGKHSNFQALSKSLAKIIEAEAEDRDDIVREEIDNLHELRIPTRGAFLSEMLCLWFPKQYPVLNKPILDYLHSVGYRAPKGASEGDRYIFLSKTLRGSLEDDPGHPARNLAELDTVIWLASGAETG